MIKIKTALISVFDKTGVLELAEKLVKNNTEILSSGGTARYLKENNIDVTEISEYTGFNEIFDGRVKTLHPKIHAGILARGDSDAGELDKLGAKKIDLVVVNLYPFAEEVAKEDADENSIIEKIDIGGPAMLRAAAKNYHHTVVICRQEQYEQINIEGVTTEQSKDFAAEVFSATSDYDLDVSNWFFENDMPLESTKLRYGENPHQEGFLSMIGNAPIDFHDPIQGKEISYNNVSDALAAWACVNEFSEPSVCIVKHTNPCGVASDSTILEAYKKAFQTDPTSAFGGVIACNALVDETCAKTMLENQFIEVLVAPGYSEEAINILQQKPNVRVLISNEVETDNYENKMIHGVGLIQSTDSLDISAIELKFATKNKPSDKDVEDLIFAMKVAKHTKSNAIVLAKNKMTLGVGAGQMSRVVSTKIAFMKAEEEGLDVTNCVLASDAFFPFRDNIDLAAEKGVSHIIQPGGSVKDEEVIEAAEENNLTMTLTGVRHFKH
tara:strand:- start:1028 stop:2515 length:1488 start_codon:yes stop_codon:yes gene_type:complete